MKTNSLKLASIAMVSMVLSACVVAPPQPIGYRMSSPVLPTYVNGQYVGMQPSNYIPPAPVATTTTTTTTPATATAPASSTTTTVATAQPAPVYLPATNPSVVYVQAPAPVYSTYYAPAYYPYGPYPYYSPYWGAPWVSGISVGIGFGFHHRH